jgi:hypothetical protein
MRTIVHSIKGGLGDCSSYRGASSPRPGKVMSLTERDGAVKRNITDQSRFKNV